ncbi:response regulator [Thiothrix eikelboomii]|uniref:Two-component system, OmpR family, response regulator BaeR n=1 Tax=Thiothrix eikelboomii TaxID=92487 RepID=A0A1T4X5D6_9GAMM|nr:response regulator [Thiothrix eikelboomii]SKA84834.1 two-component system, OmpR family, response regulator BaeR [Thiothrix eikelboomii]
MDKQKNILIVEDEPKLAEVLREYLQQSGFQVGWLANGLEVAAWVREQTPDLIILDLMLPGKDGLQIFRELRQFTETPIIMATAKVDEIDRLVGLELGADDYVCKPYSPRELVVRVKNILRRVATPARELMVETGIEIDPERMEARINGQALVLTPVEFRLLQQFVNNPGKVYSRNHLLDHLYNDHRIVTDRAVDSHIKNLRRKLEAALPETEVIRSVYGIGYKFDPTGIDN